MGILLVTIFIAVILLASGLLLLFVGGDDRSRKTGMYLIAIALVLGIICTFANPNPNNGVKIEY